MSIVFFFFSSRRRHTRCALVTGVQTCALPIWGWSRAISLIRQRACRLRSSSEPIREFRLHGDGDRLAEHVLKAHGVGQRSIVDALDNPRRSEEHTSELQSLMRISYAVFCLKKKNNNKSDAAC